MFDTDELDQAFAKAKGTGGRGGLEGLPDGEYTFEVLAAELKKPNDKTTVFARKLVVLGGEFDGSEVTADVFLKSSGELRDINVDLTKKELRILGFDCDDWTPEKGRPFGKELVRACAAMKGLRFVGTKKSNEGGSGEKKKTYHNLYVERRAGGDGKPDRFGPAEIEQAVKQDVPF